MAHANHSHRSLLPEAVRAVLRLLIVGRVPVGIREDDGVRGLEVDTETTRAGGAEVDKMPAVRLVEEGSLVPAPRKGGAAVQTEVRVAASLAELLEHVEHHGELGEDENLVTTRAQAGEHLVERLELAGRLDERLDSVAAARGDDRLGGVVSEGEGVAAHLPELHEEVAQLGELLATNLGLLIRRLGDAHALAERTLLGGGVGRRELAKQTLLALEQGLVPLPLRIGEGHPDDRFGLRGQVLGEHRSLGAAEHEGLQKSSRGGHRAVVSKGGIRVNLHLLGAGSLEHFLEEHRDERTELVEVVLEGGSRQEEPVFGLEGSDGLREHGGLVLEAVGLV